MTSVQRIVPGFMTSLMLEGFWPQQKLPGPILDGADRVHYAITRNEKSKLQSLIKHQIIAGQKHFRSFPALPAQKPWSAPPFQYTRETLYQQFLSACPQPNWETLGTYPQTLYELWGLDHLIGFFGEERIAALLNHPEMQATFNGLPLDRLLLDFTAQSHTSGQIFWALYWFIFNWQSHSKGTGPIGSVPGLLFAALQKKQNPSLRLEYQHGPIAPDHSAFEPLRPDQGPKKPEKIFFDAYDPITKTGHEFKTFVISLDKLNDNQFYVHHNQWVQIYRYKAWLMDDAISTMHFHFAGHFTSHYVEALQRAFPAEFGQRVKISFYLPWDLATPYISETVATIDVHIRKNEFYDGLSLRTRTPDHPVDSTQLLQHAFALQRLLRAETATPESIVERQLRILESLSKLLEYGLSPAAFQSLQRHLQRAQDIWNTQGVECMHLESLELWTPALERWASHLENYLVLGTPEELRQLLDHLNSLTDALLSQQQNRTLLSLF